MEKDLKKYMDELKKEIVEDVKEQNRLGRKRDEYEFNSALKELEQKVDNLTALNSYDYGVKKYYILTEQSQELINNMLSDFYKNIKDCDKFYNAKLYIDDWEWQGNHYYIKAEKGYLKVYLDQPNNSIIIFNEPINTGFNFVFDYSNKSLCISKIR